MSQGSSSGPSQGSIPKQFQELLPKIKDATCFFPCPPNGPAGFDPLSFPDDKLDELNKLLEEYGLPRKPEEKLFPLRYAFWKKMFSGKDDNTPVKWIDARSMFMFEEVELDFGRDRVDLPLAVRKPGQQRTQGSTRRPGRGIAARETSVNWCGSYVTAHDGRIITEVHGSWQVPKVDVPTTVELDDLRPHEELRCSSWVGLDGQRGYFNASLPQIGTSHFVKKRGDIHEPSDLGEFSQSSHPRMPLQPIHGVWWQWWLRDVPNPPPIKLPLEVKPGDEIMASLFVVDPTHVIYLIANHTTGEVCSAFKETEPSHYLAPNDPRSPVKVSGATGEWITERPVNWTTGQPDKLPFFGEVVFEDCLVVMGLAPRVDEREERPAGTLLINATRVDRSPPQAVTVARAERRGRGRFRTTFLGKPTREQGGLLSAGSTPPHSVGPASTPPPSVGPARTPNTVKGYIQEMFRRLDVNNRIAAVMRASRLGWS